MAGVTPTGFERKRLAEIKLEFETTFKNILGDNVALEPESRVGQLVGIFSEVVADGWEAQERLYNAFKLSASGISLDDVVSLVGIQRHPAAYSAGTATFKFTTGHPGVTVPAGTRLTTSGGTIFVTASILVVVSGITEVPTAIVALETGAKTAAANTLSLVLPVFNVDSATNPADIIVIGRDLETDAELRARHKESLLAGGQNIADALYGQLKNLPGMIDAQVLENKTSGTVGGIPAHTFEAIVRGGNSTDIIKTIWANTITGILSFGSTSGTIVDSQGNIQTVSYTNSPGTSIYAKLLVAKDATKYPPNGDDLLKAEIVEWGNAVHGIGDDVLYYKVFGVIDNVPGVLSVTLAIGTSTNPTGTSNIYIADRNHAEFDISRVEVV